MISRTKNRPLPNLGNKSRVYLPERRSQELKPCSADVLRCAPSIIQPHLEMIHLSRASMLSNACARRHMHKFGSFSATGKVTENRGAKTTLLIITPAYLRLRSSSLALEIAQPELSSGRDSAFNGSAILRNPREPTLHHVYGG